MTVKPADSSAYFNRLDAIRGVAILWVLGYHFLGATCGWDANQWYTGFANWPPILAMPASAVVKFVGMGGLGVPIFFVLSGFLIHYTYSRGSDRRISSFWFRRWGRIFPPYLAALVAFTLWSGTLWFARGRSNFLTHLFLVHNFSDRHLFGINGSFWSLAHEAQFYFLYPFLLLLRQRIGMHALLYGALAVRLSIGAWIQLTPGHYSSDPAFCLMLPRLYFEWILGMYVADCFLQGKRAVFVGAPGAWACLVFAFIACRFEWWELAVVPAVALMAAIWIDQIVHGQRQPWRLERTLMPLGVISYSVYLWHQPLVNEISQRVLKSPSGLRTIGTPGLIIVAGVLCGVASLIVGAGAYHVFEVPSMEWVRRVAQKWRPRVAPAIEVAALPDLGGLRVIRADDPEPRVVPPPSLVRQQAPAGAPARRADSA